MKKICIFAMAALFSTYVWAAITAKCQEALGYIAKARA